MVETHLFFDTKWTILWYQHQVFAAAAAWIALLLPSVAVRCCTLLYQYNVWSDSWTEPQKLQVSVDKTEAVAEFVKFLCQDLIFWKASSSDSGSSHPWPVPMQMSKSLLEPSLKTRNAASTNHIRSPSSSLLVLSSPTDRGSDTLQYQWQECSEGLASGVPLSLLLLSLCLLQMIM